MSNYATLKSAIQSAVYTNGNGEITGAGLQAVLLQIVNTVGDGYVFKGVANAGTSAGTPDANVFYIAPAGTYTNFGSSYTVPEGSIGVFSYNGAWSKASVTITDIDYARMADASIYPNGNIFVPTYVRKNKYIRSSSPYDIMDLTGGIVSGYYKLPEDAKTLLFSGITLSSGNIWVRFSQTPEDTGMATYLQFANGTAKDISSYYAQGFRYWCFTAYRGVSAEGVDLNGVAVTLTSSKDVQIAEIPALDEEINGIDTTEWVNGYVSSSDGAFVSGAGYKTSPFIEVQPGQMVYYTGLASATVILISCYTTNSGNAMLNNGVFGWRAVEVRSGAYSIPAGVNYIRISYNNSMDYMFGVADKPIVLAIKSLEKEMAEVEGEYVETVWTAGYIANDGSVVNVSGNYRYSDYIPVDVGEIYDIGCSGSAAVLILSGYASQSQSSIVSSFSVAGSGAYRRLQVTIPSGVNYIRVTYNLGISGGDYYVRKGGRLDNIEAELNSISSLLPSNHNTNYVSQLKRYTNNAPKKACVVFEFDANQGSQDDAVSFAAALQNSGINCATFGILSNVFANTDYVDKFLALQNAGHEINWHTLPSDSIGTSNPEPHPTVAQYRTILARELSAFESKGFATPIGVITSQGAMVADLIPPTKEYLCYGHTTANTPARGTRDSVLAAVNTTATDRYMINRIGLENLEEDDASVEATLLANAKAAVDKCVNENGMVVFYTHWYDNDTRAYWLRESVLTPLLAYIKTYIDQYRIISSTMAEIANIYLR